MKSPLIGIRADGSLEPKPTVADLLRYLKYMARVVTTPCPNCQRAEVGGKSSIIWVLVHVQHRHAESVDEVMEAWAKREEAS